MSDGVRRFYYGSNRLEDVCYSENKLPCRIVRYGNDCVVQQYSPSVIEVWGQKESGGSLKRYVDHYTVKTISTPCPNGCGEINVEVSQPDYSGYKYYTDFWLNTTLITVYAYDAQITPEEYWDITNISSPTTTDIQNTSITVKNSNNFAVTCYCARQDGSDAHNVVINANSTATISNLTTRIPYQLFYRADRTKYRKTSTRMNKFINHKTGEDLTEYGTAVAIAILNADDIDKEITIYGATIEETTEIGTGTIDSSIISVIPQVAEWHVMWTGKDYKTPSTSQKTYDLDYFSGLQVGNNNLRVTGYYRNTPAGDYVITQSDLPFSIKNGNYTATLYSMECTASDTLRVSIKASSALTNFYFTKIEQYY